MNWFTMNHRFTQNPTKGFTQFGDSPSSGIPLEAPQATIRPCLVFQLVEVHTNDLACETRVARGVVSMMSETEKRQSWRQKHIVGGLGGDKYPTYYINLLFDPFGVVTIHIYTLY